MATLAPSLQALRADANRLYPARDKDSDGWIGDAAHQARPSDHNPGARGLVHAFDLDEDLDGNPVDTGADLAFWAEHLRQTRDPRIKYVIYEAAMFASYDSPKGPAWHWRPYSGINLHRRHLHVSILSTVEAEQDTRRWFPIPVTQEDDMAPPRKLPIAGTNPQAYAYVFEATGLIVDQDREGKPLIATAGSAGAFDAVFGPQGTANALQIDLVQAAIARAHRT